MILHQRLHNNDKNRNSKKFCKYGFEKNPKLKWSNLDLKMDLKFGNKLYQLRFII